MEMSPARGKEGDGSTGLLCWDPQSKLLLEQLRLSPQLYNPVQSVPSFSFPSPQGLQRHATSVPRPSPTPRSN